MNLEQTAQHFQTWVYELARQYKKDPILVYQWWKEYCQSCRYADQSPVMFEFEQWYEEKLKI